MLCETSNASTRLRLYTERHASTIPQSVTTAGAVLHDRSMFWLEALFGDSQRRMFPGLPGDPPGPETLGWIALHALAVCLVVACVRWSLLLRARKPGPDWILRFLVSFSLVLGATLIPVGLAIRARNYGRWGDLKSELIAFTAAVRAYETVHGTIDTKAEVDQFYRAEPARQERTFSFTANGPEVEIVYRWWAHPPRVMIIWGRGSSAGFDLDTMICEAYD